MKVKARNIVQGWPRSRSTASWARSDLLLYLWGWRSPDHHGNYVAERDYHERQQEMIDSFFAAWRAQPPFNRFSRNYFRSALGARPIFMETCADATIADIVEQIKDGERPFLRIR